MEQFNLDTWFKDKSRKVVTRDGREVRIICTDCKSSALPIIAEIQNPKTNTWFIDFFNVDGTTEIDKQKQRDLFFADEEEELTEFEKELERFRTQVLTTSGEKYNKSGESVIKEFSKKLLDLARKEILKGLPKWKKFSEEYEELDSHVILLEDNERVVLTEYLEKGDYYIELDDLKILPKEELIRKIKEQ